MGDKIFKQHDEIQDARVARGGYPIAYKRGLALILPASVVLLFFDFGSRFLATNDETRFPLLARDILAHGTWLLPRLNGSPHLNKPPLYAWLVALASWPLGSVTQWSAALPSLLAALGVVLGTYWIAWRLFDAGVGVVAGLIVLTTYGVFTLARVPMPDMTLCAAFTAAMAAYVATEFSGRRRALVAFYVLLGLAFWTKGPVGLLPLAVVVLYSLATYGWMGPARLVSTPGLLLLVSLLAPWWVLATTTGRDQFWQDVVITDMLHWYFPTHGWSWRLVTEPISQAFTILLPWSLLLPVALWSAARPVDPERIRRTRLLLVWAGTVFVLTAISQQQRMRYYLPLCPPAALVIALWYSTLKRRPRTMVVASVWMVVAAGLSLWHAYAGARHNAATDLRAIAGELQKTSAPVYAVDVPELVFSFHLERPVIRLPDYHRFESYLAEGRDGYLIIADRALRPSTIGPPVRQVGGGLVNGRHFSVLAHE